MKIIFSFFFIPLLSWATQVVVVSDFNSQYGSMTYLPSIPKSVERIIKLSPDLVISTGDMVAGQMAGLDYPGMWRSFHYHVTRSLQASGVPFAPSPGNHDGSGAIAFKGERAEYIAQWKKYRPNLSFVQDSHYPVYYAFKLEEILFVSLDATLVGKLPEEQKRWLKQVLTENSHLKKKVIFGHLPIFPVSGPKSSEYINDPDLIKMLQDHKIDLYLSGHQHAYYPGRYQGIRQISQGCLGDGPRRLLGHSEVSSRSVTVIDFLESGDIQVEAYGGDHFDALIERKKLPEKIQYQNQTMYRDDISFFNHSEN